MKTNSGRLIDPLNLQSSDIDWADVAHHLSMLNRFVGAAPVPLNVACHSVFVSRVAERLAPVDRKRDAALQGLVHDASEYILNDVTKWLKSTPAMAGYREAEARAHLAVCEAAGVPAELWPEVEAADVLLARVEGEFIWGPNWSVVPGYCQPLTPEEREPIVDWEPIGWRASKLAFLARLDELGFTVSRRIV